MFVTRWPPGIRGIGALGIAAFVAGCGGSGGSPTQASSATGSVAGHSFQALGSFSSLVTGPGGAGVSVAIANRADPCSLTKMGNARNVDFANVAGVSMTVSDFSASAKAIGPGTYQVNGTLDTLIPGQGKTVAAQFSVADAHCQETMADATGGTITLSVVKASEVVGSFDLEFPGGDRLSGTFTAPSCDLSSVFGSTSVDAGPPACVQ
jgi:hypothetical protein